MMADPPGPPAPIVPATPRTSRDNLMDTTKTIRPPPKNPRRRALLELGALGVTVAIWAVAQPLGLHVPVLAVLIALWSSYFLRRASRRPALLGAWGVLPRDWSRGLRLHGAAALPALAVVAALGAVQGTLTVPRHVWFIVLVYPPWAWCQQFLLQNALVANVAHLGLHRRFLPIAGGVAFGGAHLPDLPLAGLTLMGGLLWTWLFLRSANLWLLAIGHGVVGTVAFMWVLGRDPLSEYPTVLEWLG